MDIPVIILAAGRGTRMRELTASQPKHLLEVAGRPFLTYLLDNIIAAGYRNLYLVVGYHAAAAYAFAASQGKHYQLTLVNQFERLGEERYGTLVPLEAVAPELASQAVLVVSGDNLYSAADLAALHNAEGTAIGVLDHNQPERFGVVVLRPGGTVERIVEKPALPPSSLINTGLYRFSGRVWDIIPQVQKSPRGEYELTDAVNLLAAREPVRPVQLNDYWYDFGRPEDIAAVTALVQGHPS